MIESNDEVTRCSSQRVVSPHQKIAISFGAVHVISPHLPTVLYQVYWSSSCLNRCSYNFTLLGE